MSEGPRQPPPRPPPDSMARAQPALESPCSIRFHPGLPRLLVGRVLATPATKLLQFEAIGMRPLVLGRGIVAALAGATGERDDVAHGRYSAISVTTPAPTARPRSPIPDRRSTTHCTRIINS